MLFFPRLVPAARVLFALWLGHFLVSLCRFFFCENSFFAFFSSGENVKEFFRRVAAITFEQAILGDLESRGTRLTSPQKATGGVLSKYSFTLYLLRNVCSEHRRYQRRQNITLGYLSYFGSTMWAICPITGVAQIVLKERKRHLVVLLCSVSPKIYQNACRTCSAINYPPSSQWDHCFVVSLPKVLYLIIYNALA